VLNLLRKLSDRLAALKAFKGDRLQRKPTSSVGGLLRSFLFFVLFYMYLWLQVDLRLIYHGAGIIMNFPFFYKGWAFFRGFLLYPGGPIEYSAAFLSQLFYYSWLGALVVTAEAWGICACLGYLLKVANWSRFQWVRFIGPLLLLITFARYTYFFPTTLALTTALVFVCLYLRIGFPQGGVPIVLFGIAGYSRLVVFLALSIILYYVAGGAFLFFAVLCAIFELLLKRRWHVGLLYLLSAVMIPYVVGVLVFSVSIINAFSELLPISWKIMHYETRSKGVAFVYALYLLPVLAVIVSAIGRRITERVRSKMSTNQAEEQPANRSNVSLDAPSRDEIIPNTKLINLRWFIESAILFVVACAVAFYAHDDRKKAQFEVDYYACHRMWPQVLDAAQRATPNHFVVHAVSRALYHMGRLGDEMFCWPQHPHCLFFGADMRYRWTYWQNFDVHIDIGLLNVAENALTECLEGIGDHPLILQRLALINMVKGNIDTARVYLGTLSKTLFHADWARDYLARLQSDPNLSTDGRIQYLRSVSLEKDIPTISIPEENVLTWLLEKNGQNRMAFEYLMALHLLSKHLGKFVSNIDHLKDFSYLELPRYYEEATLVYVAGTGKRVYLRGYRTNPSLRQEFEDFSRILHSYDGDKQAAYSEVVSKYRDTYFFYYIYAFSGAVK